jgi:hypothetical protein
MVAADLTALLPEQCRLDVSLWPKALLARTGLVGGASNSTRVDCPDCDRKYFVVPNGNDQGAVLKVVELK